MWGAGDAKVPLSASWILVMSWSDYSWSDLDQNYKHITDGDLTELNGHTVFAFGKYFDNSTCVDVATTTTTTTTTTGKLASAF
jgi:hypothetical protein